MLKKLALHHVGPAADLTLGPVAPRFNLIAGDNGLGKSFLLEAAWWALTRTWHETMAVPSRPDASINYSYDGHKSLHTDSAKWNPRGQAWVRKTGRPPNPGLVIYARVDGSFSTWDPARNYRLYQRADGGDQESPAAYQFTSRQVMEGLTRTVVEAGSPRTQVLCAGLIDDWTRWQDSRDPRFELLTELLARLGPDAPLRPGQPMRPTLDDQRRIPTILMPYGQEVPLTYCPAGVKRMCKLAYLLAWTFSEHQAEAERISQPLSRQVIVLIDEPETHLHPRWQRTVLPSLVDAIGRWHADHAPAVQAIVATHSPLILASMESIFDTASDALWKLDLVDGKVGIGKDVWTPRGDVNRWLTSDVFDLPAPTSRATEDALEIARHLMNDAAPDPGAVRQADERLAALLPQMDPFFIRWRHYMKAHLGTR
ncbi:MAG: AAA family ATPase [bacterium]